MGTNKTISIKKEKTWFRPKILSAPSGGTVQYICEGPAGFFNTNGGTISYTGTTLSGDVDIYVSENTGPGQRQGQFSLTATTNSSSEYEGIETITCGWTIVQDC